MNWVPPAVEPVRLSAPRPPAAPPPYSFPLVASVAPVVVAVAMWAITRSPFALMFAALGPVVAVASLLDARIQARRSRRKEGRRFRADLDAARRAVEVEHEKEAQIRDEQLPSGSVIASSPRAGTNRWMTDATGRVLVSLGRGAVASRLILEPRSTDLEPLSPEVDSDLADLAHRASRVVAPVAADARTGIGICGPTAPALSVVRGIVLQLARSLSPADYWCSVGSASGGGWGWLAGLPHPPGPPLPGRAAATTVAFGRVGDARPSALVSTAAVVPDLPGGHATILRLGGGTPPAVIEHPDRPLRVELQPDFVTEEQATHWAGAARADAERDGLVTVSRGIPDSVALEPLLRRRPTLPRTLACSVGAGAEGQLELDLVRDGPHAIIGGATGSGKSELLVSWVLAMAAAYPPSAVTFLLADFKGGAALAPVAGLPHAVGFITDLDDAGALRALESLRAELRHRERALAAEHAKGIDELEPGRLPRLVIVVDEFAAVVAQFPDLHALFADIASRGRSLGVHLILCTQRPGSVAQDSVLANTDLRICLRVNNRADSFAVLGTDAATALAGRGRALVARRDHPVTEAQIALAEGADAENTAGLWPGPWSPRRPWCEPLPTNLPLASFRAPGAFGLCDLPNEQRQVPAVYDLVRHGNLLVLGANRSGKTTALQAIGTAVDGAEWIPAGVEGGWDAVTDALALLEGTHQHHDRLLVLDDLDGLLPAFTDEHRSAFLDRLTRLLRSGPGRGIRMALSAQRISGELQNAVSLTPAVLLLRQASKQDHTMAGGTAAAFDPAAPPGRGSWRGSPVQVGLPATIPPSEAARTAPGLGATGTHAVASARPEEAAALLSGGSVEVRMLGQHAASDELVVTSGPRRTVILGDPEQWQARWGALASLRGAATVVLHGCSVGDFRSLTQSRQLPPPLNSRADACWVLQPGGTASRAVLAVD